MRPERGLFLLIFMEDCSKVNILQERAYSALTKETAVNQWQKQLEAQVKTAKERVKFWPQEPQRECVVYDWPKGENR